MWRSRSAFPSGLQLFVYLFIYLFILMDGADLEHVCADVVGVFHHHRLYPGQSVWYAVLLLVADSLQTHKTCEVE